MSENLVVPMIMSMVALVFVGYTRRRPVLAVFIMIAIVSLSDLFQIGTDGINLGVTIYLNDIADIVMLSAGALVLKRNRQRLPSDAMPCIALFGLSMLNFLRGIPTYGIKDAGNNIRENIHFVAPALAVMLIMPAIKLDSKCLARWIGWVGLVFGSVAILRWIGVLSIPGDESGDFREVERVLNANYAFVVAQAFLSALYLWLSERRNKWWGAVALPLAAITLALQHRSVWLAVAVGFVWLAFRTLRTSRKQWTILVSVISVCFISFLLIAPRVLDSAKGIFASNVEETEKEDSTWAWRVAGYQEATARILSDNPLAIIAGPPAGWAMNVFVVSSASTFIHSRYISTLANYGIVGLVTLLIWLGVIMKSLNWSSRLARDGLIQPLMSASFIEALLLAEIVYLAPYAGGIMQGASLGLIWVVAKQSGFTKGGGRPVSVRGTFEGQHITSTLES